MPQKLGGPSGLPLPRVSPKTILDETSLL
jgi:hypothetical protein